jgi:hypothetical protein
VSTNTVVGRNPKYNTNSEDNASASASINYCNIRKLFIASTLWINMSSSPGYYDDDDCDSVQLEGSDVTPRAAKVCFYLFQTNIGLTSVTQTILRQRFTMRRYNLEKDGRLTNQLKAME